MMNPVGVYGVTLFQLLIRQFFPAPNQHRVILFPQKFPAPECNNSGVIAHLGKIRHSRTDNQLIYKTILTKLASKK